MEACETNSRKKANLRKYQKRKKPEAPEKSDTHSNNQVNTAAQSPEVTNACISYTQEPVQQNDIDEADDDELTSIIFEEAVESYDKFKQMGEKKLGGKGSKSDGITCNVTDTPVTDTPVN